MNWYIWSDEQQVAEGPYTEEELLKLFATQVIRPDSRVAEGGAANWQLFRDAFPHADVKTGSEHAKRSQRGTGRKQGKELAIGLIHRAGAGLGWGWSVLGRSGKGRIRVAVMLILVLMVGFKIHSKMEKEQRNREFRERVVSERRSTRQWESWATNTVRECPSCKGRGVVKRTYFPSLGANGVNGPDSCRSCFGRGSFLSASGREVDCKDCNGRGVSPEQTCGECNGRGTVSE